MEKNSVRSAGKLHEPARYSIYPYEFLDQPIPLCSLFAAGVEPSWSPLPPNCEACEIAKETNERLRGKGEEGQTAMDL